MEVFRYQGRDCVKAICQWCGAEFFARLTSVEKGEGKYCSRNCSGQVGGTKRAEVPLIGPANGNWKGGISKDFMRYKRLQIERYPERVRAREITRNAIKRGDLIKRPCQVCGDLKSFAHHDDYSKPLDVQWFCRTHHTEHHKSNGGWGRDKAISNPAPAAFTLASGEAINA